MNPCISIIIPTRNEEEDIRKTLEACVANDYERKEIVVVDDSTDKTPAIVSEYKNRGVRLVHRKQNIDGRCGARNHGIMDAKGEIVVILNADVLLPKNFLKQISRHYEQGAGYVLVESKVINHDKLFPRFLWALHKKIHSSKKYVQTAFWTEGYSCLKSAIVEAGLFPTPPITLLAGEDGYTGKKIHELGFKRVFDTSIEVSHYAPYTFSEFWRITKERISAPASYFLEHASIASIFIRALARTILVMIMIATILPIVIIALNASRFSPKQLRDVVPFSFVLVIQQIAFIYGKWTSFISLIKYKTQST